MNRLAVGHRDEREVDLCLLGSGQFNLGLLSSLLEARHGLLVLRKIDARFFLEFSHHPSNDFLVEIIATEFVVSCCGFHLNLWLAVHLVNFQH